MPTITAAFARMRQEHRTGLVTYVTAGYPDPARSAGVLLALDRAGVDLIEVGVPFSDPVADGPVIQRSSERALANGVTLESTLRMIAGVRGGIRAPIVLFTYANPLYRMGLERFAGRAADAGVNGVLALDVPAEESDDLRGALSRQNLDMIFLVSPTTTRERLALAASLGSGFLYAISRLGVTGARASVAEGAEALVARVREVSPLPVAVGFGISRPEHVREVGRWADAAVVGSALIQRIDESRESADLTDRVTDYVLWLRGGPLTRPTPRPESVG